LALLHRLARDTRGGPMIEFALLAPMIIALILAIIQTALVYLAQEGLETATEAAARLIMTGQAAQYAPTAGYNSGNGMTAQDFSNAICGKLTGFKRLLPNFLDCSRLYVNVTTTTAFSAASTSAPSFQYNAQGQAVNASGVVLGTVANTFSFPASGFAANSDTLASGSGAQIVVVQLLYLWPTTTAPFGFSLVNQQAGSNRLIYATSVLVTENYS
jgi:Flp pilus assembly protein TadG